MGPRQEVVGEPGLGSSGAGSAPLCTGGVLVVRSVLPPWSLSPSPSGTASPTGQRFVDAHSHDDHQQQQHSEDAAQRDCADRTTEQNHRLDHTQQQALIHIIHQIKVAVVSE